MARVGPHEDCGGPCAYRELAEQLRSKRGPNYRELREWAGDWHPDAFDLVRINAALQAEFRLKRPALAVAITLGQESPDVVT